MASEQMQKVDDFHYKRNNIFPTVNRQLLFAAFAIFATSHPHIVRHAAALKETQSDGIPLFAN